MRRVVIRCDGGTDIGMGHVVRGVALAEMLSGHFEILFILQETEKSILQFIETNGFRHQTIPRTTDFESDASNFIERLQPDDIVVLDGYHFKTAYQQKIRATGRRLVAIDDLHAWHHAADVVINHADGIATSDYDCEAYTQLCLGFDYLLLRKAFLHYKKRKKEISSVRKCLISMGAADVNNLTQKFAEALLSIASIEQIVLLASDVNPHLPALKTMQSQFPDRINVQQNLSAEMLAEQIHEVDVVICPASSISLEACAVGVGLLTGYTAENQKGNHDGLRRHGVCASLGDMNLISGRNLSINLYEIFSDVGNMSTQVVNQSRLFDGKSALRLTETFKKLS